MKLSMRLAILLSSLSVPLYSVPLSAVYAEDFFFKDGDRVVMIGDSITEQHLYSNYVEMWTVTRFPKWKITFRNVGIGGDRSVGGNSRFARDVLLHKPTAMTVDFGMNDGSYREFSDQTFKPYMDGLQGMADQATAANIRTAWVTPQPLDNDEQGKTALTGYNQTLEKFSEGVRAISEKNSGKFVDQFHPYLQVLDAARSKADKYNRITAGDAVHPGPPGQALMAASILKGMNFPSLVAAVEIDAKQNKVVSQENCSVEGLQATATSVKFKKLDKALPFFPEDASSILPWTPILDELNDYKIQVTGLAPGKYKVRIDSVDVAELSAESLGAGVDIAAEVLKSGPIADQAKKVKEAVENKNRYHHDQIFRGIVLTGVPEWIYSVVPREQLEEKKNALVNERLEKVAQLDVEVAESLKMQPHQFEIVNAD
ncbi:MAG: SGNH/GDSL hydrolase family protein [Planctomycetota bacterium]|nr:SGNH/GDSL hydrolase family protein [Planctomycetota bacterium]